MGSGPSSSLNAVRRAGLGPHGIQVDLQEAALGDTLEECPKDPGRGGGNSAMQDLVDVTMKDPGWREAGEEARLGAP